MERQRAFLLCSKGQELFLFHLYFYLPQSHLPLNIHMAGAPQVFKEFHYVALSAMIYTDSATNLGELQIPSDINPIHSSPMTCSRENH